MVSDADAEQLLHPERAVARRTFSLWKTPVVLIALVTAFIALRPRPAPADFKAGNAALEVSLASVSHRNSMTSGHSNKSSKHRPVLFCFAVVTTGTYEVELIQAAYNQSYGIFRCDHWSVYADNSLPLGKSGPSAVEIPGPPVQKGHVPGEPKKWQMWLNTEVFLRAWKKVVNDTRAMSSDWIVKIDPDTVFFPNRLSKLLRNMSLGPDHLPGRYFLNCKAWHCLQGPLEIFSPMAIRHFMARKLYCLRMIPAWNVSLGEDQFMHKCLRRIGVHTLTNWEVMGDYKCPSQWYHKCGDQGMAAFHPIKFLNSQMTCYDRVLDKKKYKREVLLAGNDSALGLEELREPPIST